MRVQIENADWRVVLDRYVVGSSTFVYLDPPYIPETRRAGGYKHELTTEDHKDLVGRLLRCPAQCMLSGYASDIYKPLEEAGWERIDWVTVCHAAGRTRHTKIQGKRAAMSKQKRVESVWLKVNSKGLF